MNSFRSLVFFIPSFFIITLNAQQDYHLIFQTQHMNVVNPAYTGTEGVLTFKSIFRSQWLGVEGAPQIQTFSFGFPGIKNRLGWGALITNDKTFVENNTVAFATFSYRLPINDQWNLFLGVQAGGKSIRLSYEGVYVLDNITLDSNLQNFSAFRPNFGVGVYLRSEQYYFSFSIPQILATHFQNQQDGINSSVIGRPHFFSAVGMRLPLKGSFFWMASGILRYVRAAPLSLVLNTGIAFKNIEFTMGYQWKTALSASLMLDTGRFFSLGYAYQIPSNKLLKNSSSGIHEFMIKIKLNTPKKEEQPIPPPSIPLTVGEN